MANFILEVGTEELPASFVSEAIAQWQKLIPVSLQEHNLATDSIEVFGTPRRLAVVIKGLPVQQSDRTEEVKGPPVSSAFKDGKPTPAAIGFAKKQAVDVDALEVRATDKGDFVFIRKLISGIPTAEILTQLVPNWIFKLEGKRLMRWGDGDIKFPRPIRWLISLLDQQLLPISIVNNDEVINSDRTAFTHRVLHPQPISIDHADNYVNQLSSAFVQVNQDVREAIIKEQLQKAANNLNGFVEIYSDLLAEVVNLVEYPTVVVGKFDEDFLSLPPEVITTVMVTHQRYFPLFKNQEKTELLPYFLTISNGDPSKNEIIAEGNGRVIRARLADGQYFYKSDLANSLESYLPKLESVTFQAQLGSVKAKVDRIINIAQKISHQLNLPGHEQLLINRAALLCKADLVTQMVGEFPELQGNMGQKYALASGEPQAVADGIFEHYLPRGAGDKLPHSLTGQIVGLADRLDTLVSIFGLGMLPSGSSDPFALRRAANAIVNITWSADLPINLSSLLISIIGDFVAIFPKANAEELTKNLQEFFLQRIRNLLQDEKGIDYDLVNAVLGENDPEYTHRALTDLLDVRNRAIYLQTIRDNGKLAVIYETVNRSTRLAKQGDLDTIQLNPNLVVNPEFFNKSSEQQIYDALGQIVPKTEAAKASRNYEQLVTAIAEIAPTVSEFFDGENSVLVMDPNPDIKRNRLNLLGLLRNHARILADFGAIVKS
jgi:glycyl-tRNA synthetase beta chain